MKYCETGDHEASEIAECMECGERFCEKHGDLDEPLCNECVKLHSHRKIEEGIEEY